MATTLSQSLLLAVPLAPLAGSIIAGLFGKWVGRRGAHMVTILGVLISFIISAMVLHSVAADGARYNQTVYEWMNLGGFKMEVGFLVDGLTAMMMVVVTFVSLMVHIYTIGYMEEDPGYQRFFSYISLFTFSMLMLVMSNNFLQLFFGWEAVGLVSYLLIGFWFKKPSAIFANLKAFLVNRVGDFGFILGIGLIAAFAGTLNYAETFAKAGELAKLNFPGSQWMLVTVICICLFIGAMGKSAQFPLHVWLPDSMEGPTPISALIHAATMVTAGIFMVARMSPLFEHSEVALSFVLVIGATTAFFMGLLGVVNNDIKRVVAYSTLSQLGYMTAALGASAYSAAIFHLMTHAFFKALLFLAAGSVIIGMHHEQDMRKMGGLAKYMPITAATSWIGALALVGTPFLSGFYSKDTIIEAVGESHRYGAVYAYYCVLAGVFVTSLYTFRMLFMTFHGPERFKHAHGHGHATEQSAAGESALAHGAVHAEAHTAGASALNHGSVHAEAHGEAQSHGTSSTAHHDTHAHDAHSHGDHSPPHESPAVVTIPLIALAIPSVIIGFITVGAVLFGDFFGNAIQVLEHNDVVAELAHEFHGATAMAIHGLTAPPFWLAVAGAVTAYIFFLWKPSLAHSTARTFSWLRTILLNKYYFDWINENIIAGATRLLGRSLWRGGDAAIIDGALVNGSASLVGRLGGVVRLIQTGYLYSYAFWMIIGLAVLLGWFLTR